MTSITTPVIPNFSWKEEQFSYQGEYYSYQDVTVVPKPYQEPHPPTRIAAASEDTFSLAGKLGHHIFISANTPIPQLQERLALYWDARHEAGHSGAGEVSLRIPAYVAEDSKKAASEPEASTIHAIQYAARELIKSIASEEGRQRLLSSTMGEASTDRSGLK